LATSPACCASMKTCDSPQVHESQSCWKSAMVSLSSLPCQEQDSCPQVPMPYSLLSEPPACGTCKRKGNLRNPPPLPADPERSLPPRSYLQGPPQAAGSKSAFTAVSPSQSLASGVNDDAMAWRDSCWAGAGGQAVPLGACSHHLPTAPLAIPSQLGTAESYAAVRWSSPAVS
jgi:hypothetical protein